MKKKSQLSFAHPSFDKPPTPDPLITIHSLDAEANAPEPPAESLAHLKATDINAFNSAAEARFILLTCELISELGEQSPASVIREAAFELNISTETAKRYLVKHTARRAHLGINERNLVFCRHALYI